MNDDTIQVLLITGYSRSGSTLLARILAELDGVVAPGELRYLWRRGLIENRRCDCGEPCRSCSFWQKVLALGFGTLEASDIMEVLRLQDRVDRIHRIPALAGRAEDPTGEAAAYLSCFERLYRAIHDVSGARIIVDSSKDPSYGHVLALSRQIDLSVVHLVRDSRAVAHSWTRHRHDPGTGRPMARQRPIRSAFEWEVSNRAASWLTNRVASSLRLRYEDLVRAPSANVARVLALLGEEVAAPLEGHRVELGAGHAVSGNPMRFQKGDIPIRDDAAWRRELGMWDRGMVTTMTWPSLMKLGYLGGPP